MSKQKKERKAINSYVVIAVVMFIMAVLTWFIPGGQYELDEAGYAVAGTYQSVGANAQGFWDLICAPIVGMVGGNGVSAAISISLYVLLFGSFLEMMDQTGVISYALGGVSKKFETKPYVLIFILVFIMAFLGTTQGAYEEGYVYVSLFLPIFLKMGMDPIMVLMISIFGTQIGCATSVVNPFSTGIASDIAGIAFGDGIVERSILFIVLTSFVAGAICLYSKFVKQHPEKSVQFYRRDQDLKEFSVESKKEDKLQLSSGRRNALVVVFIMTFVIMLMALFPWTSINENFTIFQKIADFINTTPIIKTIIGSDVVALGDWYFTELSALMLAVCLISGIIAKFDINKTIDIIIKGAGSLLGTALMVPMARGIQVIMTQGNITATILHGTEVTFGSLPMIPFIIVISIIYLLMAVMLPSSTGLAGATISIMVPLGTFAGVPPYVMIIIYNFALGLAKMFSPCSIIVMTCTSYAKVQYLDWIKATWKHLAVFFLVMMLFSIGFAMIG